jgi:hypothetical protein
MKRYQIVATSLTTAHQDIYEGVFQPVENQPDVLTALAIEFGEGILAGLDAWFGDPQGVSQLLLDLGECNAFSIENDGYLYIVQVLSLDGRSCRALPEIRLETGHIR